MHFKNSGLHFLTLNAELGKSELLLPFLADQHFDLICLQEVNERNLGDILTATGLEHSHWVRMQDLDRVEEEYESIGIAIASRHPLENIQSTHYSYFADEAVQKCEADNGLVHRLVHSVLLTAKYEEITVATTHLCWTKEGACTEFQYNAIHQVLLKLEQIDGPIVFCGDLNAPRGNGGFELFAELLDDTVPLVVEGSLDPDLHYSKKNGPVPRLMVDGLFIRDLQTKDFAMHTGISDHVGFSCTLQRASE